MPKTLMPKTFGPALAFALACGGSVAAAPLMAPAATPAAPPPIVLAADGCGPGYFRTIAGDCRPNQRVMAGPRRGDAPPPCPRGFLRDPDPARPLCYPVF